MLWSISVAIEDRYFLMRLNSRHLLPDGNTLEAFVTSFRPLRHEYRPILDLAGLNQVTNDVVEFASLWAEAGAEFIASPDQIALLSGLRGAWRDPTIIRHRPWKYRDITLAHFADDVDARDLSFRTEIAKIPATAYLAAPTLEEWEEFCEGTYLGDIFHSYEEYRDHHSHRFGEEDGLLYGSDALIIGSRYLKLKAQEFGRHSLMTQLCLAPGRRGIEVAPFHAYALYETSGTRESRDIVLARPSILARKTGAIFEREFAEFSRLLSDEDVTEAQLQKFFERRDSFIKMLGYKSVYAKVVLARDDDTSLQPDFMVEPFDSRFWDILEIKKPDAPLLVGARDRKDFSAQVHQLRSQLREYSAYFDEDKYRKRVLDRYGFTAYRPRLVGIIGTNYDTDDELQLQRVKSQYQDTRIVTFEQLRTIAENRLLI